MKYFLPSVAPLSDLVTRNATFNLAAEAAWAFCSPDLLISEESTAVEADSCWWKTGRNYSGIARGQLRLNERERRLCDDGAWRCC